LRKNRNRIAALRVSAVTAPKAKGQEKNQESEGDAAVRD
jgi:hypothetical protein